LTEIYRILKSGGSVFLFETYKDHDAQAVKDEIHYNLRKENIFRRMISPHFLMRQFQMTYTTDEIKEIIKNTPFAHNFAVEKTILGRFPAWLRIRLSR